MAIIRLILGKLILFFNWAFPPRGIKRDPTQQAQIDQQTASLKLYRWRLHVFIPDKAGQALGRFYQLTAVNLAIPAVVND
jgi:hypothetical protein